MKKNKENKEKEKSNYFKDFEVPEDRVVNNREVNDVVLQNNLMMTGNVSTDYDALQEIQIRWDREFNFWRNYNSMLMVRILKKLKMILQNI